MPAPVAANLTPPARGSRIDRTTLKTGSDHAPPDRHAFATTLKSLRSPRTRSHEEQAPGAAQQAPARKADPKREKITAAAQGQASPDGAEQAPEEMEALEAGDATVDQMTDAAVAQAEDGSGAAGVGLVDSPEAGDEDNETADADAGGDGLVVTGQVGSVGAGDMSVDEETATAAEEMGPRPPPAPVVRQVLPRPSGGTTAEAEAGEAPAAVAAGADEVDDPALGLDLADDAGAADELPEGLETAAKAVVHGPVPQEPRQPVKRIEPRETQAVAVAADVADAEQGAEQGAEQEPAAEGDADTLPQPQAAAKASAVPADSVNPVDTDGSFEKVLAKPGAEPVQAAALKPEAADAPATDKPARPVLTERAFADQNHGRIVSNVRTQLLPNGGSMQIRLNPDNLGPMNITVRMIDGMMSAAFVTSSDEATKLLGHTLGQLKSALETQGVSVDKIQVTQAPREAQAARNDHDPQQQRDNSEQRQQQQESFRQQQERRQLLNRMWQRLAAGGDPLDLVA